MHPSYPRPVAITKQISFVDIFHLEKYDNFPEVRRLLLLQMEGKYILKQNKHMVCFIRTKPRSFFNFLDFQIKYTWKRVLNLYIICIVSHENKQIPMRPYKVGWFALNKDLLHHRLDIVAPANLCRHLNQAATLG